MMKWILTLVGISVGFLCLAQQDTVTLSSLVRLRSAHFTRQQANARAYALKHHKPFSFTDEKGNLARMIGLNSAGFPIYFTTLNAGAAITTGASQFGSGGALGLNVQGQGMVVGVWDGGLVKDHIELGQRVIAKEGTVFVSHSVHVTGTLIATGINPAAKGMAPLAQAITKDFDNDEAEMSALAKPDQTSLLFSNHSYGTLTGWYKNGNVWEWAGDSSVNANEDYRFGFYDTRAQTIDQIAALAPYYTIVWAAGNDRADTGNGTRPADCNGGAGYDCIIPEGVAKNIITVGAVEKVLSYSNPFDVPMSFFSSWGPTDDGRIKPDIVGAGVNLFSLSAAGTNGYTTMSGTSMATPNVTGSLMLLQELYGKLHGGNKMKAATLKALAIHSAKEAGNFPGPDYSFGWGLLDVAAGAKILLSEDGQNTMVRELSLNDTTNFSTSLTPKANQKITATIAWTDPAAKPNSPSLDPTALNLVNDLDLRIIDDKGREQLPWTLSPTNPSHQATPGDNFRDNVEKLEFNSPEAKTYTLVVRHKANLATPAQDFSLILSYQSLAIANTYFWVGDSGNWMDGNHWSLTSGGPPALQIPAAGDKTIVDGNSFDGVGNDMITLTQDAACASLLWINSNPSGISLNNNTLTITGQWIVASPVFSIQTKGKISFMGGVNPGKVLAATGNLANATLLFNGGTWNVKGNIKADELQFNAGIVTISSSAVLVQSLVTNSATAKSLHLDHSTVRISTSSNLDGNALTVTADNASLIIDSATVNMQWQAVNFPGEVIVGPSATMVLNGNNEIGKLSIQGVARLSGSDKLDTLVLYPGGEMNVGPATIQTLTAQTQFSGDSLHAAIVSASASASLLFLDHTKLCFDYLNVSNVGITGSATVNVGIHSTLSGASNWQQGICDSVLFADFDQVDNCAGGLTEFKNQSSGNITTYSWTFGNGGPIVHDINPLRRFESIGSVPVTLEVSNGTASNAVTKDIQIVKNTLLHNQIIFNEVSLGSQLIAQHYQWFKDGVAEVGATNRFLTWDGAGAVYFVVAYDSFCNISSDTLTIAGLDNGAREVQVFPNPASDWITIILSTGSHGSIALTDLMGRRYSEMVFDNPEIQLPTHSAPNGVYILEVKFGGREIRRKVVILHGSQ